MKGRSVVFAPEAENDLFNLYSWISDRAAPSVAIGFVERIQDFCHRLDIASERGTLRHDVRPGLRVIGFERKVAIAFTAEDECVTILRVFYGGQSWEKRL